MTESPTSDDRSTAPGTDLGTLPRWPGSVIGDIGRSPTPYHAVTNARRLLLEAGFEEVEPTDTLPEGPGGRLVVRGGSLVAWVQQGDHRGFTLVGAHTDSPNLRIKTRPNTVSAGIEQLGVEIYGGVLLNSWLDRGLGLAGRVSLRTGDEPGSGVDEVLILDERPVMLVPQLAIHLDREIVTAGLKLDPQRHLAPLWALAPEGEDPDDPTGSLGLRRHVGGLLEIDPDRILAWDLMAFDTQPPTVIGRDGDLFSTGRVDNLLSSFCGVRALAQLAGQAAGADQAMARTPVLALYDHEEIGSTSATGAAGSLIAAMLERIAAAEGASRADHLASLQSSLVVSADGAHATHPNYPDRHEPAHRIELNKGVVIKRNANQRYATDAESEGRLVDACEAAGVPLQYYIHRNDLPCGSTIGPITAARLGVSTVDIGAPQLAMHSARETAGVADVEHLGRALGAIWAAP